MRTLERSIKRLHRNEARLQNDFEHLKRELAATKNQLAQREAELTKLQASIFGGIPTISGWDNSAYPSPLNTANTDVSPSQDSEIESLNSSSATLVWVETVHEQPVQMHVHRRDDLQIVSKRQTNSNSNGRERVDLTTGKNDAAYVFQLDVAVVAMEFVLK